MPPVSVTGGGRAASSFLMEKPVGSALAIERMPDWPAAMSRDLALAYTGVAEVQLRAWERGGKVNFRARGPRGAMLALRSDLDAALIALFTSTTDEDLDFG
jgi:hypothetical protein